MQNASTGNRLEFKRLRCRFLAPVSPGTRIRLQVDENLKDRSAFDHSAEWVDANTGKLVCKAMLSTFSSDDSVGNGSQECEHSFLVTALQERTLTLESADGATGNFRFVLDRELQNRFLDEIGIDHQSGKISPANTVFAAAMLSTLVGMLLPGRYATFVGFDIEFDHVPKNGVALDLSSKITETATLSSTITGECDVQEDSVKIAAATFETLVNPAPVDQPGFADFRTEYSSLRLDGKVAIVVGGSRGIGEAATKTLAALGANVTLLYFLGEDDAKRISADANSHEAMVDYCQCDIRDGEAVDRVMHKIADSHGVIDIVVNCAAYSFAATPLESLEWADFVPEIDVSLRGLHHVCHAVVPIMKNSGGGKIVNLSSVVVSNPVPSQLRYTTAKSAVAGYTRALARDVGRHNIQVNMVTPGMTETDLVSGIPAEVRSRLAKTLDAKRHLQGFEVARAIAFLCSDWSDSMNGQQLVLNLGQAPFGM